MHGMHHTFVPGSRAEAEALAKKHVVESKTVWEGARDGRLKDVKHLIASRADLEASDQVRTAKGHQTGPQ